MRKKVKYLLERLDESIDQVQSSSEFKEVLKTFSQFHNYSFQNSLLIKMQCPEATFVSGYKQWQDKFNRNVKKGEKGIAILAPFTAKKKVIESKEVQVGNTIKEEEVERTVRQTYFRPVYVFDVSQTEGEPLPELDLSVADSDRDLLTPLLDFARSEGITVEFKSLPDKHYGYTVDDRVVVNSSSSNTEQASILVHELAHIFLHSRKGSVDRRLTKEILEMEAESVTYVVMDYFGVEIKSDKYLALYKESYDLSKSLERIKRVSSTIIDYYLKSNAI